jgi:hypothetical protein
MKRVFYLITCVLLCFSCKKETIADFEISGITKVGEKLSFLNHSINSDTYYWDFGDGNNSTEESPTHIYSKPGDYTINLEASGENGDATINKLININGTTFSFKNSSSIDIPFFCTFYWNGYEVLDYFPHGAILINGETDPTITTRPDVRFAIQINDIWLFGRPYYLIQDKHNEFVIYDTTGVNIGGKGLKYTWDQLKND